jgi:hypothetical protein
MGTFVQSMLNSHWNFCQIGSGLLFPCNVPANTEGTLVLKQEILRTALFLFHLVSICQRRLEWERK